MLKARRAILLAKAESSYSVDPTLAGASDSMLARNVRIRTLQQALDERRPARPWFGAAGKAVAKSARAISFDIELAGSSGAGTAPPFGPLLKACGCSETVTPATSTVYAPISTGESSVYMKFFMDGKVYPLAGARGDCSISLARGRVPLLSFNFIGLYVIPADASLPTPTLSAFQTPLAVNQANTPTSSVHSYAAKLSEFELAFGNQVFHNNKPQIDQVVFLDRLSRGRVKFEEELVATKDWYTIARAGTTGAISIVHGTAAGNIATIGVPNAQLEEIDKDEEDAIAVEGIPFNARPGASGSDEFSLTFT